MPKLEKPPGRGYGQGREHNAPDAWPSTVRLEVPAAPRPFDADGRRHLVYELLVLNMTQERLRLVEVGAYAVKAGHNPLVHLPDADSVRQCMGEIGAPRSRPASSWIAPGQRVAIFLWIALDLAQALPSQLEHALSFERIGPGGSTERFRVDSAPISLRPQRPPTLSPPLRGHGWLAVNGPSNLSRHRRALLDIGDEVVISQRFAIDWVRVDQKGQTNAGGAERRLRDFYAYGEPVYAAASGMIHGVRDGIGEQVPMRAPIPGEENPDRLAGNRVCLQINDGLFLHYAHLQPGSLHLRVGQKVARGDLLARVGNSGDSTEPHLHFHAADGPSIIRSEGIPFVLDRFGLRRVIIDSQRVIVPDEGQLRVEELPLEWSWVEFD